MNSTATPTLNSAISMAGTLKNMLSTGFSIENCIFELVDDSLGAAATHVRLTLAENRLIVVDNGSGMSCSKLRESHILNNRSAASATKHGRFGIGRKFALVGLTQLQGSVRTLTCATDGSKSQLDINFPHSIRTDSMELAAHEISVSGNVEWLDYAIEPTASGTITIITLSPSIYENLLELFTAKNVQQSLLYRLSVTYHPFLVDKNIELVQNGVTRKAVSINPLVGAKEDDTDSRKLTVYRNTSTSEVRVYYSTNGIMKRYYKNPESGHRKEFTEEPPTDWDNLGSVTIHAAYAKDWLSLQTATLLELGLDVPSSEEDGIQSLRSELGGIFFLRNGRIIQRNPPMKATSGDKARYPFVEQSRYAIEFQPVVSEAADDDAFTLDNLFGVQVNKSRIDESLVHPAIWEPLQKFMTVFVTPIYNRNKPVVSAATSDSSSTAQTTLAVTTPAVTTPAVTTPAVTTPAVTTPAVTTPAVTTPAVTTPAVTTPAVTTPAVTTPAVTPSSQNSSIAHVQPVAKVQRAATSVSLPVSDRRVIEDLEGLAAYATSVNFEALKNSASNLPKAGNAALCSSIAELIDFINDQVE